MIKTRIGYARIDLKNATIRLEDGFNDSGTVNGVHSKDDTTLNISGLSKIMPVGNRVEINGQATKYLVTAQTDNGTETTSVTISPGLEAALSGGEAVTVTGVVLEVKIGNGNLTYTENKEYNYERDRGKLDTVREGDEQPVDVNLDFAWEFLKSVSPTTQNLTIEEFLKNEGSLLVSSSSDPCEPFAVNIEVQQTQPCPNVEDEFVTIKDFRHESLEHNIQDAQVSMTGRANVVEAELERR